MPDRHTFWTRLRDRFADAWDALAAELFTPEAMRLFWGPLTLGFVIAVLVGVFAIVHFIVRSLA